MHLSDSSESTSYGSFLLRCGTNVARFESPAPRDTGLRKGESRVERANVGRESGSTDRVLALDIGSYSGTMAKARRHKGGRVTPKGTRPAPRTAGGIRGIGEREPEADLMRDARRALTEPGPLPLLALASSLLAVVDPRQVSPWERVRQGERDGLSRQQLIQSFLEIDRPETSALLAAIETMGSEELERTRIRRELDTRSERLPSWLYNLEDAEPYRAVEMTHVLGDGDDVIVGVRMPGGDELSILVYIDHNMGTLVKDAFVIAEPIDDLVTKMREVSDDPDTLWSEIALADARVRITEGIDLGAITFPPFESDTWPACRPLVEWITRLLPAGGTGYVRPEWDDAALADLREQFLASTFANSVRDRDTPDLVDALLWFATGYGPGDPLRWSPVAVEILLDDWIPRKIIATAAYLTKAPDVLRAFVAFCFHERGIRRPLLDETLAAIDRYEPDYQRSIRSPRPQGPEALLVSISAFESDEPWNTDDDPPLEYWEIMLEALSEAVGGADALARLTDEPLPDEPFNWYGVAEDIRPRVEEILAIADSFCEEVLDLEYRTACRRVFRRAVEGDENVFRRKSRSDYGAAALCWIVGKANELFVPSAGGMLVKDLMTHFGIQQGSVSQRANTLLGAGGFSQEVYGEIRLGSPEFLVSARRRRIIDRRDRYLAIAKEHADDVRL